uniref:HTH psq-type domain-containing protein n=1 Tax=Syphacia muris TaxID=451379 RepID=A0A158R5H2_9BILA
MATSLLIPAQQSTSNSGGVFAEHSTHSPPAASTAESSVVDRVLDTSGEQISAASVTPVSDATISATTTMTNVTAVIERRKKKPYKELTLEEKVQLIRLAEENAGMSQASIAEKYAIAKSNVCRILQRKHEYLRAYESAGFAGSRKRKLRGDPEIHCNNNNNMNHSNNSCNNNGNMNSNSISNTISININTGSGNVNTGTSVGQQQSAVSNSTSTTTATAAVAGAAATTVATSIPTAAVINASAAGLNLPLSSITATNYYDPLAGYSSKADRDDLAVGLLSTAALDNRFGNETLRAHMYKQHQISRMFMCRCCNWAFPDKTSLHMHMQAKEEGKNISVPVIGKGNPPLQASSTTTGTTLNGSGNSTPTLHVPQPRAPGHNPFAPLQLHSLAGLPAHQPLTIADPNSLQNAAASLFPQMALLRGTSTTPTDDLLAKLRERLMLNNLVAQSGLGLAAAAWLANFPKVDQPDVSTLMDTTTAACPKEDETVVSVPEEEDEINVENEGDEEMHVEQSRSTSDEQIDVDNVADCKTQNELDEPSEELNSKEEKQPEVISRSSDSGHSPFGSATSDSTESTHPSEVMPALRSAISSSLFMMKPSNINQSSHTNFNDTILNITAEQNSIDQVDGHESHISPSDTCSISPPSDNGRKCYECSVHKGKLAVAENRCRYLESRTATLQSEIVRLSTRLTVSETTANQYEQENRILREQNEILQRKLLKCQEMTLTFMQGEQPANAQAVTIYLNDILKTAFLH